MNEKIIAFILTSVFTLTNFSVMADMRDDKHRNSYTPIPGATEEINKYMEEFNATPQWQRDGANMIYPEDMRTLFSDGRTEPVKQEEIEQYMTTEYAPWLKVYHLTTEQQLFQGIKGGEYGQYIYTIATSPFDPNVVLLGNNTTGVYKSTDGGKNWKYSVEGMIGYAIDCIAFDPDVPGTVYAISAGTRDRARFGYLGLYKSTDNGDSWFKVLAIDNAIQVGNYIAFGGKDKDGRRPMYVCSNDTTNYATTGKGYKGIFRSWDGGKTWDNIGFTDRSMLNIRTEPKQNILFAAVIGAGLQASYDNGDTWTDISVNIPITKETSKEDEEDYSMTGYTLGSTNAVASDVTDIAIDPYDEKHWVVGTYGLELFETKDAGKTWAKIDSDYSNPAISDTGFLRKVEFSNYRVNGNTRLFINMRSTVQSVRFSDDNGKTFTYPDFHKEKEYFVRGWDTGWVDEGMAFSVHDPNLVFCGRGSTPRISTDGGENFFPSSSGYSGAKAEDFFFDENGVLKFIGMTDTAIWRMGEGYEGDFVPVKDNVSRSVGITSGGCVSSIVQDPRNPNHYFYTIGGGEYGRAQYIFETFDGFNTWSKVEQVAAIQDQRIAETNDSDIRACVKLKYHDDDPNVIYTEWFRSDDNGKTWKENTIKTLAVCEQDNDILYGGDFMSQTDPKKIYISYDRGETWSFTGMIVPHNGKWKIAPDVSEKGVLWFYTNGMVYRLDFKLGKMELVGNKANGIDWNGFRIEAYAFAQNPRDPNHIVIGTRTIERNGGVPAFETLDGGKTWHKIEEIPEMLAATYLEFHPTKPQLYISTLNGTLIYYYDIKKKYDSGELVLEDTNSEVMLNE